MAIELEAAQNYLKKKEAEEEQAFKAAVKALEEAIDAKLSRMSALNSLREAKGLPTGHDPDRVHLAARRQRECKGYVRRALTVTFLDRLGFT